MNKAQLTITGFICGIMLLLSSCYPYYYLSEDKVKQISLNMTKEEVVYALGDKFEVIYMEQNDRIGLQEIIGYKTQDDGLYKFYLENNKLVKIEKVWLCKEGRYAEPASSGSISSAASISSDNSSMKSHLEHHRNAMLSGAKTDSEKASVNSHMDAHSKAVLGE